MLEEVRITGLGVIDDAVLELSSGFTVLTGETGAGKTMVVTALGLLFGGRADPARVRPGAERATVEGRLFVSAEVAREVEDAGGDLDDNGSSLVLSRSVSAEGRSRAFAGGRSVPVSLLQVLADDLVAVHGQADQQQLLKPGRQRDALDRFGGPELAAVLSDYRRVFARHRAVHEELQSLTTAERERAAEADMLRRGLAEVEAISPVTGEDTALVAEEERLANADGLHAAATTAHEALFGDPASGFIRGLGRGDAARHRDAFPGGGARARPGARRPRGPAVRGHLPHLRRGRRAGLLRAVAGLRPGQARRGAGTPGRARPADPGLRGHLGRRRGGARLGQAGLLAAGRARRGRRQDRRPGRGGIVAVVRGAGAGRAADGAALGRRGTVRVGGNRRADRAGHAARAR